MMPAATGRALWLLFHTYAWHFALAPTVADQQAALRWLLAFDQAVKIAGGAGCACATEWQTLRDAWPPDFSGGPAFYRWSTMMHDLVNMRLGKKRFTAFPHAAFESPDQRTSRLAKLAQKTKREIFNRRRLQAQTPTPSNP